MIHIILKGGLGNQLFQYAYALQVQKLNKNKRICVNGSLRPFSKDKRLNSLFNFELQENTRHCSTFSGYFMYLYFLCSVLKNINFKRLLSILKNGKKELAAQSETLCDAGLYCIDNPYKLPLVRNTRGDVHLFGYFQHPDVIKGITDLLRKAFTVKTPASSANQAILEGIKSCNAVCVHIRRGDYDQFPQLQVCTEKYYKQAFKLAKDALVDPVFYVFSNTHEDIQWIRENYRFDGNVQYVEQDNPDYEELRLMMACNHFIIANSTFSWWAAVLGEHKEKKVWAPEIWIKGAPQLKMLLDDWEVVDV